MKNKTEENQEKDQTKSSSLANIAKGAMIGAGIAVAGAAVLRNEKNRAKLKTAVENAKNRVNGYLDQVDDEVDDQANELNQKIGEVKKTVKKATRGVKKQVKS